MKRIGLISDTHGLHKNIRVDECDILIHAGDFTSYGKKSEVIEFLNWFDKQPAKHKVFIAGNHEIGWEELPSEEKAKILSSYEVNYLEDSYVEIEGFKLYGSPWQPTFYNWAFNLERGENIRKKWDLIPLDTDILITHGPPFGILDYVPPKNVGCEELWKVVQNINLHLKLHVFGHIHFSYGTREWNNTHFTNASICDEQYKPIRKPIYHTYDKTISSGYQLLD